jgi:hypothetical protein
MNNIPEDIIRDISAFLDCKCALPLRMCSHMFNNYSTCTARHFGEPGNRLRGCAIHVKRHAVSSVIGTLLNTPEHPVTIHFRTPREMDIARPYLDRFGNIHHTCCEGLGVMYVDVRLPERGCPLWDSILLSNVPI